MRIYGHLEATMTDIVLALAAVFISAGGFLLIANHFGYPVTPFYLAAGILVGTVLPQSELIELAQWGIAFLVFVFGIRTDLNTIRVVVRDAEVAAVAQLLVVGTAAFGVGYVLGLLFGFDAPGRNAIYFAAAATLSSTIVGSGVLAEELRKRLVYGRLASAIHFFDDVIAIGVVLVLSAATLTDPQLIASNIGYGLVFLVAGLVFYRYGFPLLRRVADGSSELVLMGSISVLIAFVAAAELAGISIVVGAFAAGLAIQDERDKLLDVHNGIKSIKDFFEAVFFVTVGALMQFPTVEIAILTLSIVLFVVLVGPLVYTTAFLVEGYDPRTSVFASSALAQTSEFALIIAIQAWVLGTIAASLFDAIILAAVITMVTATLLHRHEEQLYAVVGPVLEARVTGQQKQHEAVADDLTDHVIIVGYGRLGRRLVDRLEAVNEPYVVIENDPTRRTALEAECQNYVFGDALAAAPLRRAGIDEAEVLVSTVDYMPLSKSLLELSNDADLILRAAAADEAQDLLEAGATFVAVPDMLASEQLLENLQRIVADDTDVEGFADEHLRYLAKRRQEQRTSGSSWAD